jgi:polysaccharide export outer membrane protein
MNVTASLPRLSLFALVAGASLASAGCGGFFNFMPSAGALASQVEGAPSDDDPKGVVVVDVNRAVTQRLAHAKKARLFSESLAGGPPSTYALNAGDVVEVTIWEAPPASLFGGALVDARLGVSTSRGQSFPEQMIAEDGALSVPFAGRIDARGHSPVEVEAEIARRLKGKANQPQVLVRVVRNTSSTVTVVGEVTQSIRMPLTPKGERLLDAVAAAGGVRQPITKLMVQLTRGDTVHTLPLDNVVRDPQQNIALRPGDVITAVFQNQSFVVLGATGRNEEIPFEATGISLAQALGRSGGLQDLRADAGGVFLFRFEDRAVFEGEGKLPTTQDGKVPVIYRANLKDAATFFHAQHFPLQHGDLLYVSNSTTTEWQKFLNIVTSVVYPAVILRSFVIQ